MRTSKPFFSLQTIMTLLVCSVVALSLAVTDILINQKIADNTQKNLADKATTIARIVAHSPLVIEALNGQRAETEIQPFANEIRKITDVEFVVVMDMKGIRKSHPDINKVGQPFVGGDEGAALNGHEYVSNAKGTLGMSLRAFTPIVTPTGNQVGAVAVGILLNNVNQAVAQSRLIIYICVGFGLLVGVIGALFLARKIKNIMFGLEPKEIAKMLEERSVMLQSVREGILAIDADSRITLANAAALRLFNQAGILGDPVGKKIADCVPNTLMNIVLETGSAKLDQELDLFGITLVTNIIPLCVKGKSVGAIATFRDKTEIKQMAEELTGVLLYAEALRAQAHEFMNKLQVILGMVHMKYYDQLSTYISRIAHQHQSNVGFITRHIKDPVLAGFILGKMSYAREVGAELVLFEECFLPAPADPEVIHEIVTVIGNLVDNALEAVVYCPLKRINVNFSYEDDVLSLVVRDTGPGINDELKSQIFIKGYSTKGPKRGVGLYLVKRSLDRLNGKIEILSEEGHGTQFKVSLPYKSKDEIE
ncbi:DcuS/MalK family sensor histidine kinase [Desulfosporosinus sp. Sb-LF]|uniref:DcuS/MalK family sensor histidine kinase n=1 Tax=Desulfosporosinus sp. Sb-LF TaxID=2560027 RepID=UPI00107F6B98|nr:DcuS/MalK family sensor histidine kinase [Desulfosporosinus sp. Sb-LF]TGE31939.1 two-component system sensor histidine kinase DcuS [Desulfosporosinus sp. Sb-LF]